MNPLQQLELIEQTFGDLTQNGYKHPQMSRGLFEQYAGLKAQMLINLGSLKEADLEVASKKLLEVKEELLALVGKKNDEDTWLRINKKAEKDRLTFLSKAYTALHQENSNKLSLEWHELGIDFLVVDEAHNFKNLWTPAANYSGIKYLGAPHESSYRAVDLYFKTRELNKRVGEGVYLLTATPIKNSPLELFNLFEFLGHNPLREAGIYNINQMIDRFIDLALTPEGGWAVSGLKDLRELRELSFRLINRKTAKEVGLKLPELKIEYVIAHSDEEQRDYIADILSHPFDALKKYMGSDIENERQARMGITHLLQRVELDLEMIDPAKHRGHISPKVKSLLEKIEQMQQEGSKGLVFCDVTNMPSVLPGGRKNANSYSFHEKLITLIEQHTGLSRLRIAICNADEAKGSEARLLIQDRFNRGELSLVIGNATMAEGMDLQVACKYIWSLTLPFTPAELEQRNGRGWRQGNTERNVYSCYIMGDCGLDPLRMDLIRGKAGWYDQFWTGNQDTMDSPSQEAIPTLERIKAMGISDQVEKARVLAEITAREQREYQTALRLELQKRLKRLQITSITVGKFESKEKLTALQKQEYQRVRDNLEEQKQRLAKDPHWTHGSEVLEQPDQILFDPLENRVFRMGQHYSYENLRVRLISWDKEKIKLFNTQEKKMACYSHFILGKLEDDTPEIRIRNHFKSHNSLPDYVHTEDQPLIAQLFFEKHLELGLEVPSHQLLVWRDQRVQFLHPSQIFCAQEILFTWHPFAGALDTYLESVEEEWAEILHKHVRALYIDELTPHYLAKHILGYQMEWNPDNQRYRFRNA